MEISDIIKMGRMKKKMSQEDLGKKLGISKNSISAWETGTKSPSCEMLLKVANEVDIVEDLFPGYKKEEKKEDFAIKEIFGRLEELEKYLGIKKNKYGRGK